MVAARTWFFSTCACVTVIEGNAVFIEEAMVIGLFKGVPLAEFIVVAGSNAVLKIGQFVGVNKVPSAFVRSMALPCRTSERNMYWNNKMKMLCTLYGHTHSLSPLMQSGQIPASGCPDSVQLAKSMHRSCAGSQDHHSQSSFFPQILWQDSASSNPSKLTEYSWRNVFLRKRSNSAM